MAIHEEDRAVLAGFEIYLKKLKNYPKLDDLIFEITETWLPRLLAVLSDERARLVDLLTIVTNIRIKVNTIYNISRERDVVTQWNFLIKYIAGTWKSATKQKEIEVETLRY